MEVSASPPSLSSDRQLGSSAHFRMFIEIFVPHRTFPKAHNKGTKPTQHQEGRWEDIPLLGRWNFMLEVEESTTLCFRLCTALCNQLFPHFTCACLLPACFCELPESSSDRLKGQNAVLPKLVGDRDLYTVKGPKKCSCASLGDCRTS